MRPDNHRKFLEGLLAPPTIRQDVGSMGDADFLPPQHLAVGGVVTMGTGDFSVRLVLLGQAVDSLWL